MDLEWNFLGFLSKFFWRGRRNWLLCVRKFWRKLGVFKKSFIFPSLSAIEWEFSAFMSKNSSRVVRSPFYVSTGSCRREIFFLKHIFLKSFSDTEWKVCCLLLGNFWYGCENCILRAQIKVLRRENFFKKIVCLCLHFSEL